MSIHSGIHTTLQKYDNILHLQKTLIKPWGSHHKKDESSQKIAEIFESVRSYEEMCTLRKQIEGSNTGVSHLYKLVYHDVHPKASQRILRAINENAREAYLANPDQIKFNYIVYSDIDDTIKGSLNDRKSDVSGHYPSVFEFFHQVSLADRDLPTDQKVHLTFLSARPEMASPLWNLLLRKSLPKDIKFYSLYGTISPFLSEVKRRLVYIVAIIAIKILPKNLSAKIRESCDAVEMKNYISIALDKRRNIDRDLLLRPEVRPIMVGDCGEGDLIFLLMKNAGVPLPTDDERIPEEYVGNEKWKGSFKAPCNPTNKPLYLGFAHEFTSPTRYEGIKPHPQHHQEYLEGFNTHLFTNYVDTTLHCLEKGVIDHAAADRIVHQAKEWKGSQMTKVNKMLAKLKINLPTALQEEMLKTLPPKLQYRLKLIRSIEAYDAYSIQDA